VPCLQYGQNVHRTIWHLAIEETQYLINKPHTKVCEERMQEVGCPGHRIVKAAIERQPAMVHDNPTDGYLCYQDVTAWITLIHLRWKTTCVPLPDRCRQLTPELTPPLRGMASVPPIESVGGPGSPMEGVPPRYVYIHTPLPNAQFVNCNAYAMNSKRNSWFSSRFSDW